MPPRRSPPEIMRRARNLRKTPEPAETKLWAWLRTLREKGFHFRRKHAIGPYIADFCSPGTKLVIEVDGGRHLEAEEYDSERTAFLVEKGYKVLRFWNSDVMNKINEVEGVILESLENQDGN